MNLLFSFNVFKGFKTILQHTEIKMIEIMAKSNNFNFWAVWKM